MPTLLADAWADRIIAITALIGMIIGYLDNRRRQNRANEKSETNTQNIQTVASVGLANTKAIQAMPGPTVPPGVEQAARDVRNDPSVPVPPPMCTDPVCPAGESHEAPSNQPRVDSGPAGPRGNVLT